MGFGGTLPSGVGRTKRLRERGGNTKNTGSAGAPELVSRGDLGEMRGEMSDDTGAGLEPVQGGWRRCLERLEEELPSEEFNTWIRPLHGYHDRGRLMLIAPNRYVRDRVEEEYLGRIAELVASCGDGDGRLELTVGSREGGRAPGGPMRMGAKERAPTADGDGRNGLNPLYVFDSFVEGKSNELAKAAATQVAANVGKTYNPLLLYGEVGLGKTHLMHAVGNEIHAKFPNKKTLYVRSERFVNDMVQSIRTGTIQNVMQRYRSVEVLLIDDIQFFADKVRTQEEFFHLFNSVLEREHQMVLTCDRYPREVEGLEVRLMSRFVGGVTVEVEPPDLETRAAILQKKAEARGFEIPDDVALYIAERIRSNVRELEGALRRTLAHAEFTQSPVTKELVRRALHDLIAVQRRLTTIEHIQRIVADYYKIKHADMLSKRRSRAIARPRQMAMCLARELTSHSLPEIGDRFGGRDHTTVLYACQKIAQLREDDPDIGEDYKNLSRLLVS